MKQFIYIASLLFLFAACGVTQITAESDSISVSAPIELSSEIETMIEPYRDSLDGEMNLVIATASENLERGRPNGLLNNWATNAVLEHQKKFADGKQAMCLLNVGGLRNPLNKGDITVGDVFKLMPFDNEVVWVEMPISALKEMSDYLLKRGGEPIAGAVLKDGSLDFTNKLEGATSFWVVTSDYLMNGGDNMSFFEKQLSVQYANILLRDLFLEEVKNQGELIIDHSKRIILE